MNIMTTRIRNALPLLSVLILASVCMAQTVGRIEISAASNLPSSVKMAVQAKGYRVALQSGTADFWFAKNLTITKREAAGALYPELSDGEFVGLVSFAQTFTDFRGQSVPSGVYTLRYQLLPQDGNHLGVSSNPDFLLAIPVAADAHPEQAYAYKKLIALSAKSTGGSHPAVIAMETAGEPGTLTKADTGLVFSVAVPANSGMLKIGICLTCSASQ